MELNSFRFSYRPIPESRCQDSFTFLDVLEFHSSIIGLFCQWVAIVFAHCWICRVCVVACLLLSLCFGTTECGQSPRGVDNKVVVWNAVTLQFLTV